MRVAAFTLRRWARLRTWRRRVNRVAVETEITRLDRALTTLSISDTALPHTRAALHTSRTTLETMPYGSVLAVFAAWIMSVRVIKVLAEAALQVTTYLHLSGFERALAHFLWVWRHFDDNKLVTEVPAGDFLSMVIVIVGPFGVAFWWLINRRLARGAQYRHKTSLCALRALTQCAEAYVQEPGERRSALRQLDISSREVERALLHAPNAVGTMPRRSCRE